MKRTINFAKRNFKEIIRDPLSIIFSILLPIFLLVIFKQFNIPSENYALENFTPGIIIFSFAFLTLFASTLIANDRKSSLLTRLFSSPMLPHEYILGYILAIIPIVLIQDVLFFTTGVLLGLPININILYAILISIPLAIFFISLGILIGNLTSEKGASGVGSVAVQLVAFTSGMYFSYDMAGKVFEIICKALPFGSTLNILKGIYKGTEIASRDFIVFGIYFVITIVVAIIIFNKKMTSDK